MIEPFFRIPTPVYDIPVYRTVTGVASDKHSPGAVLMGFSHKHRFVVALALVSGERWRMTCHCGASGELKREVRRTAGAT